MANEERLMRFGDETIKETLFQYTFTVQIWGQDERTARKFADSIGANLRSLDPKVVAVNDAWLEDGFRVVQTK